MAFKGGVVSHSYSLVIPNFIDFMSLFRHSVRFAFSFKTIFLHRVWNMQHIAAYS